MGPEPHLDGEGFSLDVERFASQGPAVEPDGTLPRPASLNDPEFLWRRSDKPERPPPSADIGDPHAAIPGILECIVMSDTTPGNQACMTLLP